MESLIQSRSTEGFIIRRLEIGDYNKGFCELLSNLTVVGNLTEETFQGIFNRINSKPNEYFIIVFEDRVSEKLLAHGTLLVEEKFIHAGGKVGHIEDIVVAKGCQGRGLGKQLVTLLIDLSKELGCYKVILDCKEELKGFYESCGMEQRSIEMAKYHNS
ncbi:unnamed protein product [Blepharisma stoltei]|uniref:Glucosamine 6-phosphate N-acetyltransferase n=1 Tax=Blepharisma stoltei TaxID=1481888 RepID=A0AAU9JHT5_9CILI|nr:unnamed protein product [Blepharisma stoltei]